MTNPTSASFMTPALMTWRKYTDFLMAALAVGTLPILLLEFKIDRLVYADRLFVDITSVVVLIAFLTDLVAETLLAKSRADYLRHEWLAIVIVIAQALAVVPALAAAGVLRILRAGRVIALVSALMRHRNATFRRHATGIALGTAALAWLTAAAVFTLAEDVGPHGHWNSYFDALWWAAATMATVGYGDISPSTFAGRVAGIFLMVVGVSAFAVITAKVAEFLVRQNVESEPSEAITGACEG